MKFWTFKILSPPGLRMEISTGRKALLEVRQFYELARKGFTSIESS
jgi:hypothetical protein